MDWWELVVQVLGVCSGIGAAFAAFGSWKTARELNRIETERDAKQARAAERYQAEHVAVVGVYCPDAPKGERYAILVVNGSDAPIYDIRVESQKADKSCDNHPLHVLRFLRGGLLSLLIQRISGVLSLTRRPPV